MTSSMKSKDRRISIRSKSNNPLVSLQTKVRILRLATLELNQWFWVAEPEAAAIVLRMLEDMWKLKEMSGVQALSGVVETGVDLDPRVVHVLADRVSVPPAFSRLHGHDGIWKGGYSIKFPHPPQTDAITSEFNSHLGSRSRRDSLSHWRLFSELRVISLSLELSYLFIGTSPVTP